jgi:hypothetical protein
MRVMRSLAASLAIGIPGFLSAQDATEPQAFAASPEAQPIAASADGASSTAPLRWKPKNIGVAQSAESLPAVPIRASEAASPVSTARAGWNITRIDPSVRPAQAISDPFQDPFGDRKATAAAQEPMLLLPTQAESAVEELPPPKHNAAAPELRAPQRMAAPAAPLVSTTQEPPAAPGIDLPFARDPTMPPPAGVTGLPCDQIYNERNCCDTLANCNDFRNRLLADTIRNISLDITPRFSPDLTIEEDEAERTDKLRLADTINWHNRQGQVIATGKMANLMNNVVIVVDDAGKEVARLPVHELGEMELCYVTAFWRLPSECGLGGMRLAQRSWIPSTYAWHASALCHKPLYFEEVQLERYGHTAGPIRQPIISSAHFFLNIAALPYNMAISPPKECEYALGYYRPGSCAPWMIPPIPLSLRGAAAETGAVLGAVFLIP